MAERLVIDKLENLENKHGIELNVNGFLEYNDYSENFEAKIIGEVFGEIEYDLKIIISAYNEIGEIVGTGYTYIEEENFEGIQPFSETIDAPKGETISKLRVYPQKS